MSHVRKEDGRTREVAGPTQADTFTSSPAGPPCCARCPPPPPPPSSPPSPRGGPAPLPQGPWYLSGVCAASSGGGPVLNPSPTAPAIYADGPPGPAVPRRSSCSAPLHTPTHLWSAEPPSLLSPSSPCFCPELLSHTVTPEVAPSWWLCTLCCWSPQVSAVCLMWALPSHSVLAVLPPVPSWQEAALGGGGP